MPRFSSPERQGKKQAEFFMRQLQGVHIKSVGTVRVYKQGLKNVATRLAANGVDLKNITPQILNAYLEERAGEVKQKTLDIDRQAAQMVMWHVTKVLPLGKTIPVVRSELKTILASRAYTAEQVAEIVKHQQPQNALATEIAYASGLRAHELLTLRPASEQPMDNRPALLEKFVGMEGVRYSVVGKGGLTREVMIPSHLAKQLEERRLEIPLRYTDRGVHYTKHYDLSGGRSWTLSFSRASTSALTWSNGAHGLRHSYAQERMDDLQGRGFFYADALEIISQEMGHFRPEITEVYLR